MKIKGVFVLAAVVLTTCLATAAKADLITNGSFEIPTVSGSFETYHAGGTIPAGFGKVEPFPVRPGRRTGQTNKNNNVNRRSDISDLKLSSLGAPDFNEWDRHLACQTGWKPVPLTGAKAARGRRRDDER